MFHYIKWRRQELWNKTLLINDFFWVEVSYLGNKSDWEFFLYPHIDDNKKTVFYFAFDDINQKVVFENILKLNWIWPKTAFQIAKLPQESLKNAIQTLDVKFFQSIPWIWPKSAKKILLELKWNFEMDDIQAINIDQKLYKDIVKSLKWFGYETDKIKNTLQKYEWQITSENMSDVIKRLVTAM